MYTISGSVTLHIQMWDTMEGGEIFNMLNLAKKISPRRRKMLLVAEDVCGMRGHLL